MVYLLGQLPQGQMPLKCQVSVSLNGEIDYRWVRSWPQFGQCCSSSGCCTLIYLLAILFLFALNALLCACIVLLLIISKYFFTSSQRRLVRLSKEHAMELSELARL